LETNKTSLNWIIAAGVVGADIGTSVFYGTGILYPKVGFLAPIFVLSCCLMMWLLKRTYEEGLALSPYNGGAYSMILRSLGRQASVLAGALTMVSYLATAAVSALSGAYYLTSLSTGFSESTIVLISFFPIIFFGLLNARGIKEPAKLVTLISGFHFCLLIVITIWGFIYLALNWSLIDFEKLQQLTPSGHLSFSLIMYGFAAAFLGITGFESAAQIVEELEAPALETLRKLYTAVIVLVSLTAPAISLLCLLILTKNEIDQNLSSLLSTLSYKLGGRILLYIIVFDATLTLFAAVNTAYVGFIGLSTTMSKQGNLPRFFIKRYAHLYPSIQGYPLIAFMFMAVAVFMCAVVAGEHGLGILAKVYEIAFLGVMISFCIGVVLIRNRQIRRDTPTKFLSEWLIITKNKVIPLVPFLSGIILFLALVTLVITASFDARSMLIQLLAFIVILMAFYRWGVLEQRLERRNDLRIGTGKFSGKRELPDDLKKFVLCAGGTGARRLIHSAIRKIKADFNESTFELVIFHAENTPDPEGFFHELLQRVVSQQIAPVHQSDDIILTVKVLPGDLVEGLQTLKKTVAFDSVFLGGSPTKNSIALIETIKHDLEIEIHYLD
jgi:amino acid transporter